VKQREYRILIANVWSDKNRGDLAITINTIRLLKKFFPHAKISLCSIFGFNEIRSMMKRELPHTSRMKVEVFGGLLPTNLSKKEHEFETTQFNTYLNSTITKRERLVEGKHYIFTTIFGLLLLLSSWLRFLNYIRHVFPTELRRTLEGFSSSDLVIIKGGGYLTSRGLLGLFGIFGYLYPALFSIAIKKPYSFLGHSIWKLDNPLSRFVFKLTARRAILITLREHSSYNYVRRLGISANIKCLPDLAFLKTFIPRPCKKVLKLSRPIVGITVRYWHFPKSKTPRRLLNNYITSVVGLINHIVNMYGCSVLIIPHTITQSSFGGNDMPISELIASRVTSNHVRLLDTSEIGIEELLDTYSRLEVLVGTRAHSAILALHVNVPVILISYSGPKAPGMMEMLGLGDYVLDIYKITFHDLATLFQRVWTKRRKIRSQIRDAMPILHRRTLLHGAFLKAALNIEA